MKTLTLLSMLFVSSLALAAGDSPFRCSLSRSVGVPYDVDFSFSSLTPTNAKSVLRVNGQDLPFKGCFGDTQARPGVHFRCAHSNGKYDVQVYPQYGANGRGPSVRVVIWAGDHPRALSLTDCQPL